MLIREREKPWRLSSEGKGVAADSRRGFKRREGKAAEEEQG